MAARFAREIREGENRFDPALTMATVEGVVRDQEGEAIEGARIVVRTSELDDDWIDMAQIATPFAGLTGVEAPQAVKTGSDGSYRLEGVQDGVELFVGATADGYVPASSIGITVEEGEERVGVDFEMERGGTIRVAIAGETSGFAMVRAEFVGDSETPPGDRMAWVNGGKATISGLRAGKWKLRMSGFGTEETEPKVVDVTAGEDVDVTLGD